MEKETLTAPLGMRYFEVTGNSMADGSARAIEPGDIVSVELLNSNGLVLPGFYVISLKAGIRVVEIVKYSTFKEIITCHSLNPDKALYPDFELPVKSVIKLYRITQVSKIRGSNTETE